jgi:hypothetical protein
VRISMSYNGWQIVRLVACALIVDAGDPDGSLARLIAELPGLNFARLIQRPLGRSGKPKKPPTRQVRPKTHSQDFKGAVLVTLKRVMVEAAELKGGSFENTCTLIHNRALAIPDNPVDLLGSLC